MTSRRFSMALVGVALLIATAGCIGFITGDEALEFNADATTVSDAALEETDYQLARSASPNRTMNISVADQSRRVNVSSEIREYNRSVTVPGLGGQEVAQFSVYTAPSVSIAGRTINPVAEWSEKRLVREAIGSSGGIDNVQFESNRTVSSLGKDRTVSRYGAVAEGGPMSSSTNLTMHITSIGHEGDFAVVVAVHPEELDEQDRVDQLIGALEHETDD